MYKSPLSIFKNLAISFSLLDVAPTPPFGHPGSASGSVSHKYGSGSFPLKVLSGL